jgi:hypothetical protein
MGFGGRHRRIGLACCPIVFEQRGRLVRLRTSCSGGFAVVSCSGEVVTGHVHSSCWSHNSNAPVNAITTRTKCRKYSVAQSGGDGGCNHPIDGGPKGSSGSRVTLSGPTPSAIIWWGPGSSLLGGSRGLASRPQASDIITIQLAPIPGAGRGACETKNLDHGLESFDRPMSRCSDTGMQPADG